MLSSDRRVVLNPVEVIRICISAPFIFFFNEQFVDVALSLLVTEFLEQFLFYKSTMKRDSPILNQSKI